jgi:hypothetical protein
MPSRSFIFLVETVAKQVLPQMQQGRVADTPLLGFDKLGFDKRLV